MPKRTKSEALDRIDSLPDIDLPYHSKVPAIAHAADKVYDTGKALAKGLIMLDPFNRLADSVTVMPYPMIAIPAHEAYLLSRTPSLQIYIRAGETIVPTGGNVQDVALGEVQAAAIEESVVAPKKRKKTTAYQRRYKKAFKAIAPKHKLKNGKWKKGGFKAAVKAAHKQAGGKK
jgi:hypothetical protein